MKHIRHGSKMPKWEWPVIRVLLMLCLLILTGCASGTAVTYVNDSSAVVPVTAGETATATGFIISPGALSELTQCCGENLEASGSAQVSSGLTDWDDAGLIVLAAGDADGDLDIVYTE